MLHLLFFLLIDIVFFSTLVGMSSCMTTSELVYVSEWIRQCKQSDIAHQSLPVFVAISFVMLVQCQIEWMFRVACSAHHSDYCPDCPRPAAHANGYHALGFDTQALALRAQRPPSELLLALMTTFKLACILGVFFVFLYDYRNPAQRSALVYSHYYGVFLVAVGLVGANNTVWFKLEKAHNNHILSRGRGIHASPMHLLQSRSFLAVDVFLLVSIGFFGVTTLLLQNSDDKQTHNNSVISEFIFFILLSVQFMYLFWRCRALADTPPIELVSNYFRFALIFALLMLPVVVMQYVEVPRPAPPAGMIIYNVTHSIGCNADMTVVNATHCCTGGMFKSNTSERSQSNGTLCMTCKHVVYGNEDCSWYCRDIPTYDDICF